jgi:hypothetical protein
MSGIAIGSARLGRVLHAVRAIGQIARKVLVHRPPFLIKCLRASPIAMALLVGFWGFSAASVLSFGLMVCPAWRWSRLAAHYGFLDSPPVARVVCFLVCLISVWLTGVMMKALESWGERLRLPEQAEFQLTSGACVDLRSWLRRAARTAAEFYNIAFWIVATIVGLLMVVNASRDPTFGPATFKVADLLGGYLGAAAGIVMHEIDLMPTTLRFPAALLFLSFILYAFGLGLVRYVQFMRSGRR